MQQEFSEWLLVEPGESDLAEGYYSTRAFSKTKFSPEMWEKRVLECKQADSGYHHVIDYAAYEKKEADLASANKEIAILNDQLQWSLKNVEQYKEAVKIKHGEWLQCCQRMEALEEKLKCGKW